MRYKHTKLFYFIGFFFPANPLQRKFFPISWYTSPFLDDPFVCNS